MQLYTKLNITKTLQGAGERRADMRIAIVGAGFVGQATGKGFAKHKHHVTFVDINHQKLEQLRTEGFTAHHAGDYTKIDGDITMVCVPTPTDKGAIQLDYLKDAVSAFGQRLATHKKYHTVVIRSTLPPKTTREILLPIIEEHSGKKVGQDFGLAMQPEYLREATANADFERPWVILIGAYDKRSGDVVSNLYRSFDVPIHRCSLEEAEMQKYVHNLFNAVKIAFFNEMRTVAQKEGWDAEQMFQVTAESCEGIWNPLYGLRDYGPFDGSCLPKDTQAFLNWASAHGYDLGVLRAVITENIKHGKILDTNQGVSITSPVHVAI